jgi:hypothetical protein
MYICFYMYVQKEEVPGKKSSADADPSALVSLSMRKIMRAALNTLSSISCHVVRACVCVCVCVCVKMQYRHALQHLLPYYAWVGRWLGVYIYTEVRALPPSFPFSLSLSLTHTHTHSLSLSLSLSLSPAGHGGQIYAQAFFVSNLLSSSSSSSFFFAYTTKHFQFITRAV